MPQNQNNDDIVSKIPWPLHSDWNSVSVSSVSLKLLTSGAVTAIRPYNLGTLVTESGIPGRDNVIESHIILLDVITYSCLIYLLLVPKRHSFMLTTYDKHILQHTKRNVASIHLGPLARYVELRIAHAPGMPGTFSRHRLQKKPPVSDPGMHHDTRATHVPWCMSGSLTRGGGENVPGIPGACASRNFTYLTRGL